MIKTTLVVVLLAILVATIQAANPFDTNNRPFVIGGGFKRVEKKSPTAGFACYNTTLGDWTDYKWVDASVANAVSVVQLNNGHLISLANPEKSITTRFGFVYWNLDSSSVITTAATVLEVAPSTTPTLILSYDQKKLYVSGSFTRVGSNTFTDGKFRIFSFDISALPTLNAPTEITSNYGLTYTLSAAEALYAVSNGNQLLFKFITTTLNFVVYDPSSTSWKEINPTVIRITSEFKINSGNGELYAKSYDTASPFASSFWKYDSTSSQYFVNVKTLASSNNVNAGNAATYVRYWTVGTGGLYYVVQVDTTGTTFETGMQNVQRITLSPSVSDPVSLSKTRLTTSTSRSDLDTLPLSSYITNMYYDENIKQLVLVLNSDTSYQVYGARDTDLTKKIYELTYRFQPMGAVVAYDATADAFVIPYGGGFSSAPARYSVYPSTVSVSCFSTASYFRVWSPYFAVYDQGKDMFVAENLLSGLIDYDWLNGAASGVAAVENSDDSGVVYVGGRFRTISGVVYNSIVSRTKSGLVALGTGLRKNNFNYNFFDTLPGTVTKMVRSSDNKYLFVLGEFDRAGDLYVRNLAYWNIEKKTWNKLETNTYDNIVDIDYDGRYLYVVGSMTRAGKYVVKNVARFDMQSQTWLPMNDGLSAAATAGFVVNGKFVAVTTSGGSGVSFVADLAVWSSNSWKAIEMDSISNSGCQVVSKEQCTSSIPRTAVTYFKGKIYFLSSSVVYVSDTSMSKGTLYAYGSLGSVTSATRFYNYPKSNTIVIATPYTTDFIEYNTDLKNIQHTNTRDGNQVADGVVIAISSAPKNVFTAIALIVTLVVTLFF